MNRFLKSLKRQDGFTLVELMVVVAIIGLLSAVAIPNFKKYQAKAKVSEAKLQLSAVYTAQTSFFSDYNIYGQCLAYMGYDPNMERGNRYFAIGFGSAGTHSARDATAHTAAVNSGLMAADCPAAFASTAAAAYVAGTATPPNTNVFPAGKGIGAIIANDNTWIPTTGLGTQASEAAMTFVVGAGGVIDGATASTTAGTNAQLTINQQKILTVVRNGF